MVSGGDGSGDHVHSNRCDCAQEMKDNDPKGVDLYDYIDFNGVECFNEKTNNSIKKVLRPYDDKMGFVADPSKSVRSDFDSELVVVIPFKGELRIKFLTVIGASGGYAPNSVKLYKNEQAVDFSIIEEKKPL